MHRRASGARGHPERSLSPHATTCWPLLRRQRLRTIESLALARRRPRLGERLCTVFPVTALTVLQCCFGESRPLHACKCSVCGAACSAATRTWRRETTAMPGHVPGGLPETSWRVGRAIPERNSVSRIVFHATRGPARASRRRRGGGPVPRPVGSYVSKTRQWQRTRAAPGGGLVGSRRERGVGRGPR
jgi:hypothetical protein